MITIVAYMDTIYYKGQNFHVSYSLGGYLGQIFRHLRNYADLSVILHTSL